MFMYLGVGQTFQTQLLLFINEDKLTVKYQLLNIDYIRTFNIL